MDNIAFRRKIFLLLDAGHGDEPMSRAVDMFLIGLISLNVLAVVFESMPDVAAAYETPFAVFETFSVLVFTGEYLLRLWAAPEHEDGAFAGGLKGRIKYMLTPLALIDLIVILPFYLSSVIGVDLRVLRALRLFRAFRLTRYSSSMKLLMQVLRDESSTIGAALFILMLLIVIAASLTYMFEHTVQPEAFGSIPHALWWAVVTMTTIGYGDVVPMTLMGRICASVIGVISVGMVALPAGILASGFSDALHRRRREYETMVDHVLEDGVIDSDERALLRQTQDELGLSETEAATILKAGYRKQPSQVTVCGECGRHVMPGNAGKSPAGDGTQKRVSKFG